MYYHGQCSVLGQSSVLGSVVVQPQAVYMHMDQWCQLVLCE